MTFLDYIQEHVLVLDGAMGTMIQGMDVTDADFGGADYRMLGDLLSFSRPDDIRSIHLAYYRAGAHAVETNTFGASVMRLSEYDFAEMDLTRFGDVPTGLDLKSASYEDLTYALNKRSAEIACAAREMYKAEAEYDGRPLYVVGSIGPSNRVLSKTDANLRVSTFDAIGENFYQQVVGLIDGGADVLLFETQQDVLELKAAIVGARRALADRGVGLPIMAQVTVDQFSKMQIFNTDIHAALVTIQGIGADVFGINCSIGPDLMAKTVEKLSKYSRLPISVIPNAGLPVSEAGRTVYTFTPEAMAEHHVRFVTELGVNIVGGCCGTGPDHIRAIAEAVRGLKPAPRTPDQAEYVSGPQNAVSLDSSAALIRIGERLNVRGSAKVRAAVEGVTEIDQDVLEDVVKEQIEGLGLEVIDVCMDSNLVDTTSALISVIHEQTGDFAGAMSIDSFAVDVLEAASKVYPGRPIINSMSMEEVADGVTKVDAVIQATEIHNPVYIALCAGPQGPGATREDKARIARDVVENAGRHGVGPERIMIDMNVFPLGSESEPGMNFALESLEAIPLIKAIHPKLMTTCGVGNLTNGLANKPYMRKVLTSVWLDEARKRGLDAAIVNPNHYVYVEDLDKHDYDLALRAVVERDMDAFEELETIAERKKGVEVVKRTSYDDLSAEEAICEKIFDGFKQREAGEIEVDGHVYRYSDAIVKQVASIVHKHDPLVFINDYLMASMKRLGDGFAQGDVSLPHLLKSADVMKQVMGFLEEYMRVRAGVDIHSKIDYKGVIVLGTVYQDVHSIGKDLAKTLFENYGYRVIDLGVMTPLQKYLDTAREYNADAIGMSALLVQTSNHMITVAEMMKEQGLENTTVLIGGAPVNDRHAAYVAMAGADDNGTPRDNVFYCATAMDGVNIMNELVASNNGTTLRQKNREKLQKKYEHAQRKTQEQAELLQILPRRVVSHDQHVLPEAPWSKPKKVTAKVADLRDVIDRKTLFSLNWKYKGASKWSKLGVTEQELEGLLDEWVRRCDAEGWLQPQGVYGIFPCYAEGDEVVVLDFDDHSRELCRFDFTKVVGSGSEDVVSGAQYYYGKDAGKLDAIGVQISTGGTQVDDQIERFKEEGDSESALYLQGLSDRLAEDFADHLHELQREQLGLGGKSVGTRWSPGYPGMVNMENNGRIHALLDAERLVGVTLTEAGEFSPTGTTAAVVSFHPDARYS